MNLLDFYKEHVLIDPEVKDEETKKVLDISSQFNTTGLDYMYSAYQSFSDLQNYIGYRENGFPEYFKSVSGNKVIKVGDYMGIIDLWYPREICLFDLSRNPIMAGWIMADLMDRMCGTEDITDLLKLPDPKTTLNESISRLLTEIKGTEFYGFWMRDYDTKVKSLNYEIGVKKRELENLINRRSEFENGIGEYKKKIHDKLWKSF